MASLVVWWKSAICCNWMHILWACAWKDFHNMTPSVCSPALQLLISLLLLHFASSMSLFLSVSATSAAPGARTHQSFPSFSPPVSVSSPDPSVLGHFPPASVPLSAPCPLKTYRTSLSELGSALTKPTSMPSATETGIWNLQRKNSLDHFLIINSNSKVTVCCYLCRTS